jgi:hypothetical protein
LIVPLIALQGACSNPPPDPGLGQRSSVLSLGVPQSPLIVHYPTLDRRLVGIDPASGRPRWTVYPDRFYPELSTVRDFAADRRHLYLLLGSRENPDDPRLFVVDPTRQQLTAALPLPPQPQRLTWNGADLLVGHDTPASGPGGRLTRVITAAPAVDRTIDLAGACLSIAPAGSVAFVLERSARIANEQQVVALYNLAEIDLDRARVRRRLPLPGGARQLLAGPRGLLYLSHASGSGRLQTDGTISVVDPATWQIALRLDLETIPRRMAADHQHLAINTLTTSGEAWITVLDRDYRIVMDLRFEALLGGDLALLDGHLHAPGRRGNQLVRVDLRRRSRLAPLKLEPRRPYEDPPRLLRNWMERVGAN